MKLPDDSLILDLSTAARHWTGLGADKGRKLLKRLVDVNSAHTDLVYAERCLQALEKIDNMSEVDQARQEALAGYALFNQAILMYVRTTVSTGERSPQDIRSKLSGDQLDDHKLIVRLRDGAIAHFGAGPTPGGPLNSERIFLLHSEADGFAYWFDTTKANYRGEVAARLHSLILVARGVLEERKNKAFEVLMEHLDKPAHFHLMRQLAAFRILPATFETMIVGPEGKSTRTPAAKWGS